MAKDGEVAVQGNNLPVPTISKAGWLDRLRGKAKENQATASGVGGSTFLNTRGGVFKYQGKQLSNPLAVVILDFVRENGFYEGEFDPEKPRAPKCFAIGREEATLAPPLELTPEKGRQADTCALCQWNRYGSAEQGRGKACKNGFRLAILPGNVDKAGQLAKIETVMARVPPTSLKALRDYVNVLASSELDTAPLGVVTAIRLVADDKANHRWEFELVKKIEDERLGAVLVQKLDQVQPDLFRAPQSDGDAGDGTSAQHSGGTKERRMSVGERRERQEARDASAPPRAAKRVQRRVEDTRPEI